MSHTVYVAYYGVDGNRSTTYTPSISIYDLPDNTLIVTDTMSYNSTIGQYEYDFSAFDPTKEYLANIDFGASAPMRYATVKLQEGMSGDQVIAMTNTVKH